MLNKNNMTKEQEDALFSIADTVKLTKLLPLTLSTMTEENKIKRLIVIDINVLPLEMKDKNTETITEEYRKLYTDYDFLFINTSRQNMEGNILNNPPVYAI